MRRQMRPVSVLGSRPFVIAMGTQHWWSALVCTEIISLGYADGTWHGVVCHSLAAVCAAIEVLLCP